MGDLRKDGRYVGRRLVGTRLLGRQVVGEVDGTREGEAVDRREGLMEGREEGRRVGAVERRREVGRFVGIRRRRVGKRDGQAEGEMDGRYEGATLLLAVRMAEGLRVDLEDGITEGARVGVVVEDTAVGFKDGGIAALAEGRRLGGGEDLQEGEMEERACTGDRVGAVGIEVGRLRQVPNSLSLRGNWRSMLVVLAKGSRTGMPLILFFAASQRRAFLTLEVVRDTPRLDPFSNSWAKMPVTYAVAIEVPACHCAMIN